MTCWAVKLPVAWNEAMTVAAKPIRIALLLVAGLGASALLLTATSGCRKRETPPPPVPTTNTVAAPVAPPAETADLTQMTRDLRRWIVRNQRPPKDYAEFAATAGSQYPPPPVGKKFAIDKSMHVILVNR